MFSVAVELPQRLKNFRALERVFHYLDRRTNEHGCEALVNAKPLLHHMPHNSEVRVTFVQLELTAKEVQR